MRPAGPACPGSGGTRTSRLMPSSGRAQEPRGLNVICYFLRLARIYYEFAKHGASLFGCRYPWSYAQNIWNGPGYRNTIVLAG